MKKEIIIIFCCVVFPLIGLSQQTGPGNPGGEPTGSDPPIGGGAPIGSGIIILLSMSVTYLGKKVYDMRKESMKDDM